MMQLKHIGLLGHLLGQLVLVLPAPFSNQLHIAKATDKASINRTQERQWDSHSKATVGLSLENAQAQQP